MKDFGKTRSTVQPEPLKVDEYSVWVHSNIEPVTESDGENEFNGFEFDMVQYEKNEYILLMAEQIANFEGGIDSESAELLQGLKEGLGL